MTETRLMVVPVAPVGVRYVELPWRHMVSAKLVKWETGDVPV